LEAIDARIYCDDGDDALNCGAGDGGDHGPTPDWMTGSELLRNLLAQAIETQSQTVAPRKQKGRAQRRARENSKFVSQ